MTSLLLDSATVHPPDPKEITSAVYAVIRSGGRQYRVVAGEVVEVNRLDATPGDTVTFEPVFLAEGTDVKARAGDLEGVTVRGEVVEHTRGKKIRVFNYGPKKGWKRTKGHRQDLTAVRITEIG